MIIETKDPLHIHAIAQHVTDIKGVNYTPLDFIRFVIDKQVSGFLKIFIDIDEGQKIQGFIVASIVEPIPDKDEMFIDLAWINAENNGLAFELQNKVEDWARELKITKLSALITKGEQALKKKFGFKREAVMVYKSIEPAKEVEDGEPVQTDKGKS